ncbi:DUF2306 domain-containing protein [Qipengyuania sphaerica]|uniref:DUF2306 domain-containing protein n=1 Tax=Qipengyuania sphaerica TaxID=2867243 RepID=UPI0031F0746B
MAAIFLPSQNRQPAKPRLENSPRMMALVASGASLVTLAAAVALFKWLTGLAPDLPHYRNPAIFIHVATVLPAVPLGAYLLLSRKGDARHKLLGKVWIALMVTTAIAITFVRGGTDFSWIHIFVPYTLLGAWNVVRTARAGRIDEHRKHITGMYLGALIIPGGFAFLPDRLFGLWLFA